MADFEKKFCQVTLQSKRFLAKFDGQVVKMTYMVVGRFMTLDVEVVWKPYRFVGVHLLNQYIQAYEV